MESDVEINLALVFVLWEGKVLLELFRYHIHVVISSLKVYFLLWSIYILVIRSEDECMLSPQVVMQFLLCPIAKKCPTCVFIGDSAVCVVQ